MTDRYRRLGILALAIVGSLVLPSSGAFAQVDILGDECDGAATQCLSEGVHNDVVKPVEDAVNKVEDTTGVGNNDDDDKTVLDPILDPVFGPDRKDDKDGGGKKKKKDRDNPSGGTVHNVADDVGGSSLSSSLSARAQRSSRDLGSGQATSAAAFAQEPRSSFDDFFRGLTEAAGRLGFPLLLTLLVIAFLIVQGRVDHRDPKLALARVSSEQDYLSFS